MGPKKMWRKEFHQSRTLSPNIIKCTDELLYDSFFITDSHVHVEAWNANAASGFQWTDDKFATFLSVSSPHKLPVLRRIHPDREDGKHLCEFKAIDGDVQVRVPVSLLKKYYPKKYMRIENRGRKRETTSPYRAFVKRVETQNMEGANFAS